MEFSFCYAHVLQINPLLPSFDTFFRYARASVRTGSYAPVRANPKTCANVFLQPVFPQFVLYSRISPVQFVRIWFGLLLYQTDSQWRLLLLPHAWRCGFSRSRSIFAFARKHRRDLRQMKSTITSFFHHRMDTRLFRCKIKRDLS